MRKEASLLLALIALERLYLLYSNSSFCTGKIAREFLDACWESVILSGTIKSNNIKKARFLTKLKNVPREENCIGRDFYALSFLSGIDCLIAYLENNDLESLNFIWGELEVNLLDHFLFQNLFKGKSFFVSKEHENIVRADPRMERLSLAINEAKRIAEVANEINAKFINELRDDFVFDLI